MEKLLEEKKERKAEPSMKPLLGEHNNIKRLLINWHGTVFHQMDSNPERNAETLPKILCSKEFDGLLLIHPFGAFSWSNVFLVFTNLTGRISAPLWWHTEAMGRVRPAWHDDRILESNHPTLLLVSNTSAVQKPIYRGSKPISRQNPSSTYRANPIQGSPPFNHTLQRSWPNYKSPSPVKTSPDLSPTTIALPRKQLKVSYILYTTSRQQVQTPINPQ